MSKQRFSINVINYLKKPSLFLFFHKRWYYHIDFGNNVEVNSKKKCDPYSGFNSWDNFLSKHLPSLEGKRILDIGCNAGVYALRMADAKAKEVIGIDRSIAQAEYVKKMFSNRASDYSVISYVKADVTKIELQKFGRFDLVCMFCVAYHLKEHADNVMRQLAKITPIVAMQGNIRRLTHNKYNKRPYYELGGVEGMKNLLAKHGFDRIKIISPERHKKPLVVASSAKEDF